MADIPLPKAVANYRTMSDQFPAVRCGRCMFFLADDADCQLVAGEIVADCTCDLFQPRRADRAPFPMYRAPSSLSSLGPMDMPTLNPPAGYLRSAAVAVKQADDGEIQIFARSADDWSEEIAHQVMKAVRAQYPDAEQVVLSVSGIEDDLKADMAFQRIDPQVEFAITKTVEEQRYTFGPLYLPDTLDAHGDFVSSATLQKAAQDYLRNSIASGSNTIYRQHTGEPAGEWVDLVTWPFEHTVKMEIPGEGSVDRKFPPGTVYQGVVWSPSAWEDVKAGRLRGLSLGGIARPAVFEVPVAGTIPST